MYEVKSMFVAATVPESSLQSITGENTILNHLFPLKCLIKLQGHYK